MTEEEKIQWNNLYEYVRKNIMGYDENQSLSKPMVLRLKGLLTGKFMENKNTESSANYTYETILYTFKFCSQNIRVGLHGKSFSDEMHRFNYILKIVEKNINDVYIRLKNAEKSKSKIENVDVKNLHHEGAEYAASEKNTVQKSNPKLDELW
jgi:hypothetical protein